MYLAHCSDLIFVRVLILPKLPIFQKQRQISSKFNVRKRLLEIDLLTAWKSGSLDSDSKEESGKF